MVHFVPTKAAGKEVEMRQFARRTALLMALLPSPYSISSIGMEGGHLGRFCLRRNSHPTTLATWSHAYWRSVKVLLTS